MRVAVLGIALLLAASVHAQAGMALSLAAPPPGVVFMDVELIASPAVPWPCAR